MSCTDSELAHLSRSDPKRSRVDVLAPRRVPLGGPRAINVNRTLPQRHRSFVGAWCFVDHYGPSDVSVDGGMDVPPHPHTGLQTVSWLFDGEVEHRDSLGNCALIRPGEVNVMTSGRGIAHSEVSTDSLPILRGVQLWVALPRVSREVESSFEHAQSQLVDLGSGVVGRVFVGSFAGVQSTVRTFTDIVGVQLDLPARSDIRLPVESTFEYAVLVDDGTVKVESRALSQGQLGVTRPGPAELHLSSTHAARCLLLGGVPFDEELVMWWNFVGSSQQEIVQARSDWMAGAARFGEVAGYRGEISRLPAPVIPDVRLRPRGRLGQSPEPLGEPKP